MPDDATRRPGETALWLTELIADFIESSPENTLQNQANEKAFETPLVGFASGDDPIFQSYKEHVGPFHWTPVEIFRQCFPEPEVTPSDLSVISWILPQTPMTKADNRKETTYPAERWARARIFGEEVNEKLRRHVVQALIDSDYPAVAPSLTSQWEMKMSDAYGFASTWSERHAAHACGLGTFGLCAGLITPRGKAMRTASVVARLQLPATPRPYSDHQQYCLFFTKGICGKCIKRCPVGAITEAGKDKNVCRQHLRPTTAEYVKTHYGFDGYGCGLCQTGVPCESRIPVAKDL